MLRSPRLGLSLSLSLLNQSLLPIRSLLFARHLLPFHSRALLTPSVSLLILSHQFGVHSCHSLPHCPSHRCPFPPRFASRRAGQLARLLASCPVITFVFSGEAAVGKSSLVLRFVQNDFNENTSPTIGAAFLTQSTYESTQSTCNVQCHCRGEEEQDSVLRPQRMQT